MITHFFQILLPLLFLTGLVESLYAETDTTIHLKAIPGLQYDQVRIKVRPGAQVKLILSNVDDMSHNLVFTKPGSRVKVVEEAMALAEKGPEMNFIPDIPEVLWSIPVLAPGEEKSVTFKVPDQETIIPYVCTFPGHGYFMYGVLYVTNAKLPPAEADMNIPEQRRGTKSEEMKIAEQAAMKHHPYELVPPYYYRIFMPEASPASIAVRLTDQISYCWDAGPCQLLYAWQGGFIDNSVAWKGHQNTESKILGHIFYREPEHSTIRIGAKDHEPEKIEFIGYRLKNRNPEFHYLVDNVKVYETFHVSADGDKLIRSFRIPDVSDIVWVKISSSLSSTKGKNVGGYIKLSPDEVRQFSLEIPITALK